MRVCPDCHKVVTALDAVEIDGKFYHKSCRTCYKCGKIICNEFSHPKEVFNGHNYHFSCLYSAPVCCVCGETAHRYVRDYWGNTACREHGTICQYCGTIVRNGHSFKYSYFTNGGNKLVDRFICDKCAESIVKTPEEIERCRAEVMAVFQKKDITGIPNDIPISFSDMKEESKKLGRGLWGLNSGKVSPSRLRYSCQITIHENLPRLVFKGVLAHEFAMELCNKNIMFTGHNYLKHRLCFSPKSLLKKTWEMPWGRKT